MAELGQAEFLKAFARASRVDSTRQRDLAEIARLKQNNDTMRQRLLTTIAERDHYLAALKQRGIDPGPAPVPVAAAAEAPAPAAPAGARPPAGADVRRAVARAAGPGGAVARVGRRRRDRATRAATELARRAGFADEPELAGPRARHADSSRRGGRRRAPRRVARADGAGPRRRAPARAARSHGGACASRSSSRARSCARCRPRRSSPRRSSTAARDARRATCCVPEAAGLEVVAFLRTAGRREVGGAGRARADPVGGRRGAHCTSRATRRCARPRRCASGCPRCRGRTGALRWRIDGGTGRRERLR